MLPAVFLVLAPVSIVRCVNDFERVDKLRCERHFDIAVALADMGTQGYEPLAEMSTAERAEAKHEVCQ